jgi:L-ascorbate metabolism protein UlaG (beta-lactamase superfamily)
MFTRKVLAMVTLMEDVKSTKISPGQVAVWWIGQAGYIIKTPKEKVIFIDAFLSGGSFRMVPPPSSLRRLNATSTCALITMATTLT